MNVLVVGADGNMGKRYCAILQSLGHQPVKFEIHDEWAPIACDHIIVATPTPTHNAVLYEVFKALTRPSFVLCEKPISTEMMTLNAMYDFATDNKCELFCVNQYAYLPEADTFNDPKTFGFTSYDYYKSGNDGLAWDCFQLFALAKNGISLSHASPVWKCRINGVSLDIKNMDSAYVAMIEDFLGKKERVWRKEIVIKAMKRICER